MDEHQGAPPEPASAHDAPLGPPQPPAGSTPSGTGSAPGPALNPRSCVTCRRRKVRCDKTMPCSNCRKANIPCIFPAPGRAPRRPRKPPDGELLARLRRLEGVVQSLGVQVDDEPPVQDGDKNGVNGATVKHEQGVDTQVIGDTKTDSLNESFGRLVIDEKGRSRYVNNRFWAALSNEVEDLKQILHEDSDEDLDAPSPLTDVVGSPGTHGYLFNGATPQLDLHSLHPAPNIVAEYWKAYLEYYDPLMRMLHVPTTQKLIYELTQNPSKASKAEETLLFSIYFAAVSAMPAEEVQQKSGESRDVLIKKYRAALEQALTRSHLLFTEELLLLQAFIIYLYTIRRFEDSRVIWSLCGLACRIAITMGLHRDGANFAISPLDVEMRRRTWWQILTLDIRASEYHGWDPVIVQHAFDTKYPLNIEDADITAATKHTPPERQGITPMSFVLTRYHTAMLYAKLHTRPSTAFDSVINSMRSRPGERRAGITLQEREQWIHDCEEDLNKQFFRYLDINDPNHTLAAILTRMIFSKQWLSLLHPYLRLDRGASLSTDTRDRIFKISYQSLEYAIKIHETCKMVKWGWLFENWSQFHALASLLSELRVRTEGENVDRAWLAVDRTIENFGHKNGDGKNGHTLWRPIRKLYETARAARERALASMDAATDDEDESDVEYDDTDISQLKHEEPDPLSHTNSFASAPYTRTQSMLFEQNLPAIPNPRSNSFYMSNNTMAIPQPYTPTHQQPQQQSRGQLPHAQQQWQGVNGQSQQNSWFYGGNQGIPNVQSSSTWPLMNNLNSIPPQGPSTQPGVSFDGQEQQQGYPDMDPLLNGIGGAEDFGMGWGEWDEMMREFDPQANAQPGGPGTDIGGGRGVMGGTWL